VTIGSRDAGLTIIGGASVDTLHVAGKPTRVAGGAGLYTALAAHRAGLSKVTMIAPRPAPLAGELAAAAELLDWRGPEVAPDGVPHFDISYDAEGRRTLDVVTAGREAELSPQMVVPTLPPGPVCVTPLTDPRRQLEFVRLLKAEGRWVACGTYPCGVREQTSTVQAIFEAADAFFCNEEEAASLFGGLENALTQAGKLLFVSRGKHGVRVFQGHHSTNVEAVPGAEADPTGAGDALCGGALAALVRGDHPVRAARLGAAVAAQVVSDVGPTALLPRAPQATYPLDPRVALDVDRIAIVSDWLAEAPQVVGFDFCGEMLPPPGEVGTLDFFFAQTLQQFGFWRHEQGRYDEPMIAPLAGSSRKGSDYLWAVYRRWMSEDRAGLAPLGQRDLRREELDSHYRSDDGHNPVPAADLHLQQARAYGRDMTALGRSPAEVIEKANASRRPVVGLLQQLDHIGGYKEDPLRKKSALLALVLRQRPERFLRSEAGEDVPPIVDYHIQRSCLRMGLVTIGDAGFEERLKARRLLEARDESAVREACYRAVERVQQLSGKPMAAVDWFFFQNRRRCPEMTRPECATCEIESVCARKTELFQPVMRTTFY